MSRKINGQPVPCPPPDASLLGPTPQSFTLLPSAATFVPAVKVVAALVMVAVLIGSVARADEPTKFYLGEDGKVTEKRVADLEKRVAELEKRLGTKAAPKAVQLTPEGDPWEGSREQKAVRELMAELEKKLKSGDYSTPLKSPGTPALCVCGDACVCKAGECPAKCPITTASRPRGPDVCSMDGYPMRLSADGYHWERVPGAAARPDRVMSGSANTGGFLPHGWATHGASPNYTLPAAPQSCPGGRCPTPR